MSIFHKKLNLDYSIRSQMYPRSRKCLIRETTLCSTENPTYRAGNSRDLFRFRRYRVEKISSPAKMQYANTWTPWRYVRVRKQRRSSSRSSSVAPERLGLGRLSLSYWRLVVSWLVALFYYDYNSMPACTLSYRATQKKLPTRKAKHVIGWEKKKEEKEKKETKSAIRASRHQRANVSRLSKISSLPVPRVSRIILCIYNLSPVKGN